jgi:hypothetical protein
VDLTITLEDRPGRLADLGEAAGKAEINIEGMCATSGGGGAEVHVLVDDAAAAREGLGSAGIEVDAESDVLVIDVENRPRTMGESPAGSPTPGSTSASLTRPSAG